MCAGNGVITGGMVAARRGRVGAQCSGKGTGRHGKRRMVGEKGRSGRGESHCSTWFQQQQRAVQVMSRNYLPGHREGPGLHAKMQQKGCSGNACMPEDTRLCLPRPSHACSFCHAACMGSIPPCLQATITTACSAYYKELVSSPCLTHSTCPAPSPIKVYIHTCLIPPTPVSILSLLSPCSRHANGAHCLQARLWLAGPFIMPAAAVRSRH